MANFSYKELTTTGKIIEGTMEAQNENDVLFAIRERGSRPMQVEEIVPKAGEIKLHIGSKKIKAKELSIFCKQLFTMLNAGMPLISCIDVLRDQSNNKVMKETLAEVGGDIQKGLVFSKALSKHKDVFPPLFLSMIESGELSGNLDNILESMAEHYTKDAKIQSQIKSATIYPIILICVAVGVVTLMMVKVVPMFTGMFADQGIELPGITKALVAVSDFFIHKWFIIVGVIVAFFVGLKMIRSTHDGKYKTDQFLLNAPMIGKPQKMIATSRFASTLAILLSSGIPIVQAIESAAGVTGNQVIIDGMKNATDAIKKGSPMSVQFKKIGVFPPMMISMVNIGEESGSIDTMLNKTTEFFEAELEENVKRMMSMMEPLIIVLLGGVVAFIVLAIFLPMIAMTTNIA